MYRLLILLFFLGCASAPPSVKIIEQVTKNQKAVEKVTNSEMSDDDKEEVINALGSTQNLAVLSSQAWEQCKVDLSDEREGFWQWMAAAFGIGALASFFVTRGIYRR